MDPSPQSSASPLSAAASAGVELAVLAAPGPGGALRARFDGGPPVPVRAVVGIDPSALAEGRAALAVRVAGEPVPIVIGVVAAPGLDRLAQQVDFSASEADPAVLDHGPESAEGTVPAGSVQIEADGQRVTVEARDELVLRCGEASVSLRADGKVVVRGTHIVSHSTGPHRIKGGSLSIN